MIRGCMDTVGMASPDGPLSIIILIGSLVPLLLGADVVVRGGSSVARALGVPPFAVGLTIIAFGTSAPELFINVSAAITGEGSIAIGNILGSNIFNIGIALSLLAILRPIPFSPGVARIEVPLVLFAALGMLTVMSDRYLNQGAVDIVTRTEGILLLSIFGIFLAYLALYRRSTLNSSEQQPIVVLGTISRPVSVVRSGSAVLLGFVLLAIGGAGTVRGAVGMAAYFGVSEYVIAITVVAVGTSLPELATTAIAAIRGQTDIAMGNILGSNIFNIFLVLGATATIRPITAPYRLLDHGVHIFLALLLFLAVHGTKKQVLQRWHGGIGVIIYGLYLFLLLGT